MKGNVIIGKELQWEKIKVGQAFYFEGCCGFGVKVDSANFMTIEHRQEHESDEYPGEVFFSNPCFRDFYAIPKSLAECLEVEL